MIFDWANAEVVASIKVGHGEVHQMGFNPFLFTATDKLAELKVRVIYVYMCVWTRVYLCLSVCPPLSRTNPPPPPHT